jgi:hypothetical protein
LDPNAGGLEAFHDIVGVVPFSKPPIILIGSLRSDAARPAAESALSQMNLGAAFNA